ncbi:hypothetical protein AALP_AA7G162600 [Arabis alpina]|uniref:Retrotransposon gag domain-containing protein n=1 Tax=Arabis alpina TaxID=50452 RepID=A0A087GIG0_ARAAL|nr:hypothetical protein AALP_AA7G162600 [Arabis alpina]
MTDERRIADPKDTVPRDLEEGEIQAEGGTNENQAARDDPPPAGTARADLPGEKSKETPRASSLLPELLQKMSATLDALLESTERQNRANGTITDELRSIGADNSSTAANDERSALLAQARREKAKVGDEPIDLDNDDDDPARRVVPETIFTETARDRQGTAKARNDDPQHIASQQFSTVRDDGPVRRVTRNTDLPEEEVARRTTTRQKHADPQRTTQRRSSAISNETGRGYARHVSEEEENVEWVKQAEDGEAKQAAFQAQHDQMAEFRASLSKTTAELKTIRSQMDRATSKAPELDMILEQAQHTPFSAHITKARVSDPGKIRVPTYDGTEDPADHLNEFSVAMTRSNFKEEEMNVGKCLLFVENLKGPALKWFKGLESNSIVTFKQLSEAFIKHYSIFIETQTSGADLWSMNQGPTEYLKTFIERFKLVLSQVKGIEDSDALRALKRAIWHESDFWKEMSLNEPSTIQDALHRATNYAKSEEEAKKLAKKYGKSKQKNDSDLQPSQSQKTHGRGYVQHEGGSKGAHNYQVDLPGVGRGIGRGRGRGRGFPNVWTGNSTYDGSLYCDIHRTHGHSTVNC